VPPSIASNDVVILEIIEKDARAGMEGDEILFFRLYESGIVEFEDQQGPPGIGYQIYKLIIDEEEKSEFIMLSRKCKVLANEYDSLQPAAEKHSITRIRVKEGDDYREVVTNNYRPESDKTRAFYPREIKVILEKAKGIRVRYHRKA
jgi:hypothetical protein